MAKEYYDSNDIGEKIGLPGTGIIGIILGDQLHPPMVDSTRIWRKGKRWKKGALLCTERLAKMARIRKLDHVLDVGSGVGGPAIFLAKKYGCKVTGLNSSEKQIETARKLTHERGLEHLVNYVEGDAQKMPFPSESFSCLWTFNMFYHIQDKQKAMEEFYRVLQQDGRLAFDDWMITKKATSEDIKRLKWNWSSPPWATNEELIDLIYSSSFTLQKWEDYSHVGKGVMAKYFSEVFERDIKPKIIEVDKERGNDMANDFKEDVEHIIELYKSNKLCYIQFVATK